MTIKLFQVVQKNLKSLGVDPSQSVPKLNAKALGILFPLGLGFISNCFFFKNEANYFEEYVDCAYIGSTLLTTSTNFLIFIWERDELYQFMNCFGDIINKSEYASIITNWINFQAANHFAGMHQATSKMIYEESNRLSEKFSGILIFVSTKLMIFLGLLPAFIISFFNYFTTELGGEAFQFVLPLW